MIVLLITAILFAIVVAYLVDIDRTYTIIGERAKPYLDDGYWYVTYGNTTYLVKPGHRSIDVYDHREKTILI